MKTTETPQAVDAPLQCRVRPHETTREPHPVCPHCGHKHRDAWEWSFGPGLDGTSEGRTCDNCEEQFDCERVVDVSYTTHTTASRLAREQDAAFAAEHRDAWADGRAA